jgi:hypothetical protein
MSAEAEVADTEDPDVKDLLKSAKLQYSGDKVFHMSRRMSGMPLLHRMEKSYVKLDALQLRKINELLDKFPDPPVGIQIPGSGASSAQGSQPKSMAGSWGSIRGLAEKFNVFNKSS